MRGVKTRKVGTDSYIVAVPSYKRPSLLQKKTITTLKNGGVPASKVFVFVANKEEYADYKLSLIHI